MSDIDLGKNRGRLLRALGYRATLAEPTLQILAARAEDLTGGLLGSMLFIHTVAIGLAVGSARAVIGIEMTPLCWSHSGEAQRDALEDLRPAVVGASRGRDAAAYRHEGVVK